MTRRATAWKARISDSRRGSCSHRRAFAEQIRGVQLADEHGEDLGVGLALEDVAAVLEPGPQGGVVLDDAVVDERDAGAVVAVRVRIGLGDASVGRPAGVGQPQRARETPDRLQPLLKVADPPDRAADVQLPVENGHPGRVVPAVLEPLEPLDQQRLSGLGADVGDDSAHGWAPPGRPGAGVSGLLRGPGLPGEHDEGST